MSHSWKRIAAYTILTGTLAGSEAISQSASNPKLRGALEQLRLNGLDEQDAQSTQREFNMLVRSWYPPSLVQVLQLDPSLMSNDKFMESYPKLKEYLNEHPEIVRNPSYYVGRPEDDYRLVQYERSKTRDVVQPVMITAITLALVGMVTWTIRTLIDNRRWSRLSKLQTEAHAKLMDRFASNEDLLSFIQTPAGKRFLESSAVPIEPRSVGAPIGRILWSVQLGLILFAGGVALEIVSSRFIDETSEGFYVFGVLTLAVGIGFMLSGLASYLLSKRFGLFDPEPTNPFGGGSLPQGPST